MRITVFAVALSGLLLSPPTFAAKPMVPKKHQAFVVEYGRLLKKHPEARRSFLLTYQAPGKRRIQARCVGGGCTWLPEIHTCACPPGTHVR